MSSVSRERRWSFLRRRRPEGVSQTDEVEPSTSSTERRNNTADASNHPREAPKPIAEELELLETSALDNLRPAERHMLEGIRHIKRRATQLWRSVVLWQFVKLFAFVCLCAGVGLWLRFYCSHPSTHLRHFLHELDLDVYFPRLVNMGYDRMEDLIWATEEDLENAGVALRPHRVRILRRAQALQEDGHPWLLFSALFVLFTVLTAVVAFVLGMVCYERFRNKCAAVALWTIVTVW